MISALYCFPMNKIVWQEMLIFATNCYPLYYSEEIIAFLRIQPPSPDLQRHFII